MYWWEREFKEWWNNPDHNDRTDSQRRKVYAAERVTRAQFVDQQQYFTSIEEMQKYVDHLTSLAWFTRRFGVCDITVLTRRSNAKARGTCSGSSTRYRRRGWVKMPAWSWKVDTLLHEVVHAVLPNEAGASHARCFARALLDVNRLALPKSYARAFHDELKIQFKKHNVKYNPKRRLTEATRQKLRENFVSNALGRKAAEKKGG